MKRSSSIDEFNEVDDKNFTVPEEELGFNVGGLVRDSDGVGFHLRWINRNLQVGDRICIKIIQTAEVDTPRRIEQEDPDFIEQQERKYYEELKQKYGD